MFISQKLIFVELHKTGGTHIGRWLQNLVGGEQSGKHNRVPAELQDRFVIGSIRNPWDWYVSLWAYGCSGQGSVRHQSTRGIDLRYCREQLPREMGKVRLTPGEWTAQLLADWRKPVAAWQESYRDPDSPAAFRSWLHLLLDPKHSLDIGEGYGFSPLARCHGLLTYRYLKLFTNLGERLYSDRSLGTATGIATAWEKFAFVDHIVRNEQLESDLMESLERAGIDLSDNQKQQLIAARNEKINASKRRETGYYYDQASIDLVAEHEAFIIARHGYRAPDLTLIS